MKPTYIIANWKANKTVFEAEKWAHEVRSQLPQLSPKLKIILCIPLIHVSTIRLRLPMFQLGTQNLSPYPDGAYTGEVSARMLHGLIKYVLVGHSERRHYFHETATEVALKVTQALGYGITPIVSVSHKTWREQLNHFNAQMLNRIIIMYEPPEAISQMVGPIGKGETAPVEEVVAMITTIKQSAPQSPVLYGGSIKSHNLPEFLKPEIIDGLVPGSASLNAPEWLKILTLSQQIRG